MAENLTNEHQKSNSSSYFLDELTKLVQVYFYFFFFKLLIILFEKASFFFCVCNNAFR